mmetsp:Transcript_46380/g.140495  ORF Transcript_46380/g.140495 Transcript_46380/m.140495 type:complete len:230 (+) Transcript_46380:1387-2076(+)
MLRRVLRMTLHDARQSRQPQILEILRPTRNEPADRLRRRIQQGRIGIDRRHSPYAFVHHRVPGINTHIGLSHAIRQNLVHAAAGARVVLPQYRQYTHNLHLHPRRRDPMIIVIGRETMLADLFQYRNERRHQILERMRIDGRQRFDRVQRRTHHARITIAQYPAQFRDELGRRDHLRRQLMESMHRHDRLLSDGLGRVIHQFDHLPLDRGDHVGRDEIRRRDQCRPYLQ